MDQSDSGHATTKARPTTLSTGTKPSPVSLWCQRESRELLRWSPITQSLPLGTVMVPTGSLSQGVEPGNRYGSSSATPLTFTGPPASHTTVSPPTAITRLIRSFSSAEGIRPTVLSAF